MMYGPQVLIPLDVERSVQVWKCVVCDAETQDESRIDQHVMRCGAVVLREHHGMAKTAWLAGLRILKERKAKRARRKAEQSGARKVWAGMCVGRATASGSVVAPERVTTNLGAGQGLASRGVPTSGVVSPTAPINSTGGAQ